MKSTLPSSHYLLCPDLAFRACAICEDRVKYSQAVLQVSGKHMGRVAAVVQGERPYDKAVLEDDVAMIELSGGCRGKHSQPAPI